MIGPDLHALHNRLEQLADVARAAYAERNARGSVGDVAPPEVDEALAALRAALVAAGCSVRHAEWAVTRWVITRESVVACVESTDENGPRIP